MNKRIVEFPDRGAIAGEAAEWLVRLDGDRPASADELAALREWVARSPVHRDELAKLAALWNRMNVLTELAVPLGPIEGQQPPRGKGASGFASNVLIRAGIAATVFIVGIAVMTFWLRPDPLLAGNGLYTTVIGEQRTQTLADESIVLLNTDSVIEVAYGKTSRDVHLLQGEAHFTVTENKRRPFRVYAGGGRVQAVGTAFSVYMKDDGVEVTVTEGRVAIAAVNTAATNLDPTLRETSDPVRSVGSVAMIDEARVELLGELEAGESAVIRGTSAPSSGTVAPELDVLESTESTTLARRLSWQDGVLTFAGEPLAVVVAEISRYTTTSIEIADPALRNRPIGGRFPVGETELMFESLETNFGLRIVRLSDDRVVIEDNEP